MACEAIERSKDLSKKDKKEEKEKPAKKVKFAKHKKQQKDSDKKYYCTEHGKNTTHNTDKCFTLANKKGSKDAKRKTFNSKGLKQEINMLSCKSSKAVVLDQYLTVLNKEKAKLAKKEKNQMDSDSSNLESKSNTTIAVIEQVTTSP